jgi:23S rRNA (pseudouridine1915-N3)-methyltransferase
LKIKIIAVGKTRHAYIREGIEEYVRKLAHYVKLEYVELPDSGISNAEVEGKKILSKLSSEDQVALLDERGLEMSSVDFSKFLQKKMNAGTKCMALVIGGPFGLSQEVIERATMKISFSKMTFNHEMIRMFALEQLYRAHTIIKGEPYHHV